MVDTMIVLIHNYSFNQAPIAVLADPVRVLRKPNAATSTHLLYNVPQPVVLCCAHNAVALHAEQQAHFRPIKFAPLCCEQWLSS